jgi:hypothetical protein
MDLTLKAIRRYDQSICPYVGNMASATAKVPKLDECNCLAVRQAARHITQFYDRFLADVRPSSRFSRAYGATGQ